MSLLRRNWIQAAVAAAVLSTGLASLPAHAQAVVAPDAFVRDLSEQILSAAKADKGVQSGDTAKLRQLVDQKVMPLVNFERMTGMSVGPQWRTATAEQKKRMFEEFKTLMINTYAGALTQVKDQSVVVKPMRAATGTDQVVRTEIRGGGEPVQLDYRVEKAGDSWKIYDVNVGGFWLVDAYKGQFAKDLSAGGLDGLIQRLAEKNKAKG